ncbi:hypothetical protein [Caulobacter sp. S45]|uniref:hypothetical protein n=1 Tax=Caulobacter sp. S45 TaxID=1641861 RepID=UPI00131EA14B|nr:hypothetical protein [Caulobacter sp. S45]
MSSLCAIIYIAIFVFAATRSVLAAPYGDPHDWDALVFATQKAGNWLGYLWTPHTNQRIVFARILTYLDMCVFGKERVPAFLIGTLLSLFVSVAVLAGIVIRNLPKGDFAVLACTFVVMTLISAAACEDCSFPVFSVYIFVSAFAAMALSTVELHDGEKSGALFFLAALVCGVLSGFGNAAGLGVWPVLIYAAVRNRHLQWRLAATVAVAIVYIAVSMSGLGAPSRHLGEMNMVAPAHLAKMFVYFTGYCALPWSGGSGAKIPAHLFGIACALGGGLLALRGARSPGGLGRIERIGCNLILFSLLTAVMATFGRVDELPQPIVPTRYFPFTSLLQAGLILALIAPVHQAWSRFPKLSQAVAALAICLLLAQQTAGAQRIMTAAQRVRAASAAFDAGNRSASVLALVYPDPGRASIIRVELKRRSLPF